MEGKQTEVVLFGTWTSPYCTRIVLALKIKGIPFEFIEEDLLNKSELLIHYNPVYKKVPVLVHKGKPISESLVILEYIDECWNHSPKLFPKDPYEKAKARFWINFHDQKIASAGLPVIMSKGEEREKAIVQLHELIEVFEEGMEKDFPGNFPFFKGETLGIVEIVVGANSCNYEAFHEALGMVPKPGKNLAFFSWVNALKNNTLMKETLPPHDQLVARIREKFPMTPKA